MKTTLHGVYALTRILTTDTLVAQVLFSISVSLKDTRRFLMTKAAPILMTNTVFQ